MKNRSYRYKINRIRLRHGCEYTKYKMCLGMMMVMCNKPRLSNVWALIHEKTKRHWDLGEKKRCL